MTDTIPEDVSKNEEIVDKRLDAVEALVKNREEEIKSEVSESILIDDKETKTEKIPTEEVEPEPITEMVTVKVDGEEVELPLADVVKGYQKDATASQRLRQVAMERQELEKMQADFNKEQEALKQEKPETTKQDVEVEENEVNDLVAALDDLSVGDSDERAAAALKLKKLLGGRGDNPTIREEQIVSEATKQATKNVQMEINYNAAQNMFVNDYQDIVNDELLQKMAYEELDRVIPFSDTFDEAFKKAGDEVRQWKDKLVNGNKVVENTTVSNKVALKEKLPKEPVSAGKTANPKPPEKPETTQDIIAAMKTSRGQVF